MGGWKAKISSDRVWSWLDAASAAIAIIVLTFGCFFLPSDGVFRVDVQTGGIELTARGPQPCWPGALFAPAGNANPNGFTVASNATVELTTEDRTVLAVIRGPETKDGEYLSAGSFSACDPSIQGSPAPSLVTLKIPVRRTRRQIIRFHGEFVAWKY